MLNLVYFARLRESLGRPAEQIELPPGVSDLASLRAHLRGRGGVWTTELSAGRPVRAAINQQMARDDSPIADGDEIAFFPPVTGG